MNTFSTKNLQGLFEPDELRRISKIAAALDAVFQTDASLRYHSYFPQWNNNLDVAQIDNGSGDHLFCLFSPTGVVLKGFDHESPMSPYARDDFEIWPGIYQNLPPSLAALLDDKAIQKEDVTFCIWRLTEDTEWQTGKISFPLDGDDGSAFLLGTLLANANDYYNWARDYYETDIPLEMIEDVYRQASLDKTTAKMLNSAIDFDSIAQEIRTILMY